jgi:hypothetical protein
MDVVRGGPGYTPSNNSPTVHTPEPRCGSSPRVITSRARTGVLQHVARDGPRILVPAEDTIIVALLPEGNTGAIGGDLTAALLQPFDEAPEIGAGRGTLHEEVHMVRHDAVRKHCKPHLVR